jgi:hypothetical protein
MSLEQQGFRFVLRTDDRGQMEVKWVHPAEVRPSDLDCTDMDDDAFDRACQSWNERFNGAQA